MADLTAQVAQLKQQLAWFKRQLFDRAAFADGFALRVRLGLEHLSVDARLAMDVAGQAGQHPSKERAAGR